MTPTAMTDHVLAQLLSSEAHGLRNHIATARTVVRLIDDPEVAAGLDAASRSLQVALERAIVLARVELGAVPDLVRIEAPSLVSLAIRRARREGATLEAVDLEATQVAGVTHVPGPWAERLLADLLHHAAAHPQVRVDADTLHVVVALRTAVEPPLLDALTTIATACGGQLRVEADAATLTLPIEG